MAGLADLVEKQNKIWTRMQELQATAEKSEWTDELRSNWDAAEGDLSAVSQDIARTERAAKLAEVDYRQVIDTGKPEGAKDERSQEQRQVEEYRAAFGAYMRGGMTSLNSDQQRALATGASTEKRALTGGTVTAGGYLIPQGFRLDLIETKKAFGGIEMLATKITTDTGQPLPWPTVDDTANMGAILADNTQISDQDVAFGTNALGAYTYTSKQIRVPWALLQDSAFDLESFLARKLGERLGRISAQHWVSGTGSGQPLGLATGATVGVTGATSSGILYDEVIDLEYSVNGAYRENGKYVLSDFALKSIRKLKDTQGRPLWVPIPAPGFPSTINGREYVVDYTMAPPAINAVTMLFGDIAAAYVIREVSGVEMVVMRERYADSLQVGMFAWLRQDGTIQDYNAVRSYKQAAS